jgi:hypothetical protein
MTSSSYWWFVEVILSLGGSKTQAIQGPSRDTEEEAKEDLRLLQEKLGTGEWINLDWLSASPKSIIAAHVSGTGFAFASF